MKRLFVLCIIAFWSYVKIGVADRAIGSPILTNADDEDKVPLQVGRELVLECNYTDDPNQPIVWKKDGIMIEKTNTKYEIGNGYLKIAKADIADGGEYTCEVSSSIQRKLIVYTNITFDAYDESQNLVEGETLTLTCAAEAYPEPALTWYKGDVVIEEEPPRVTLHPHKNKTNAKVVITPTQFSDRAIYKCVATTPFKNSSIEVNIRIKDKYAALWPFLGICVEVTILCIIIFVYEKRRVKPEFEEADNDRNAAAENKAVSEQKEGQVRQRK